MEDNDSGDPNDLPGLNNDEDKDKDEEKEVESIGSVVGVVSRSKKTASRFITVQIGTTNGNLFTCFSNKKDNLLPDFLRVV